MFHELTQVWEIHPPFTVAGLRLWNNLGIYMILKLLSCGVPPVAENFSACRGPWHLVTVTLERVINVCTCVAVYFT